MFCVTPLHVPGTEQQCCSVCSTSRHHCRVAWLHRCTDCASALQATAPVGLAGLFRECDNDDLNLAGVLNVLDGVVDCPGRIVVMTSNHPDKARHLVTWSAHSACSLYQAAGMPHCSVCST
jgi:hypothetical protein